MGAERVRAGIRRRKKRGKALLLSYLVRAGMVLAALLTAALVCFTARAAVSVLLSGTRGSDQSPSRSQSLGGEVSRLPEDEPTVPAAATVTGVVTIDPGHGGIDPGCGEEGALEKDIVLAIAQKLKGRLERAGITVVMTRQTDQGVSLDQRADIANEAGSDLFVSIHCNSFQGEARGLECYYYKSEPGRRLAGEITRAAAELGINTRELQENNYQVLWDTDMTAVLVEAGFLSDPTERARLNTANYQDKVAQAVAKAVIAALQTD